MPETLTGLIDRVTYHHPENGFAVLKVQVQGRQDLVSVAGSAISVSAGEHLEATGRWIVDWEYGQDTSRRFPALRMTLRAAQPFV